MGNIKYLIEQLKHHKRNNYSKLTESLKIEFITLINQNPLLNKFLQDCIDSLPTNFIKSIGWTLKSYNTFIRKSGVVGLDVTRPLDSRLNAENTESDGNNRLYSLQKIYSFLIRKAI